MKKWVTIFPDCKNFHLIKDVGYIPYIMSKKFNFESYIVTFNEDNYKYLETYVKGLKIYFLNKKFKNDKIAVLWYLLRESKNIDVLHLFHLKPKHLFYIYLYKVLNINGKAYLKLDAGEKIKNITLKEKKIKPFIYRKLLKYCDLISVETTELYEWISENWEHRVEYIPNGFWKNEEDKTAELLKSKKNYITTVGRLGSEYKNNETLVEAFKKIHKSIPNWNLCLVGERTNSFNKYLESIFKEDIELKDRIILKGYISDLKELNSIYSDSKIFCMTSTSESFGLVFVEALKNGCYIITSNVLAARDVTDNERIGRIFNLNNENELCELIKESCLNYDNLIKPSEIQKFAYKNFDWNIICDNIYKYLGEED